MNRHDRCTLVTLLALVACSEGAAPLSPAEEESVAFGDGWGGDDKAEQAPAATAAPAPKRSRMKDEGFAGGRGNGLPGAPPVDAAPDAASDEAEGEQGPAGQKGEAAPERAWFPETFLFAPRVVTDDAGTATLPVPVPDRLTTWRVLGVAHDREGGQAGAVHSFAGTLPVYVDPVVPPFLSAGDVVRLPIQVVNTTDAPVRETLALSCDGATLLEVPGAVSVPAGGSVTAWATLQAEGAGLARLRVALGATDAVTRTLPVQPRGRRVEQVRSGTLAAARSFDILGAADLDPASARVQVVVHPGALALLRSELATAGGRAGLAGAAYALTLGTDGAELLGRLGLAVTETGPAGPEREAGEALRTLALRAGQQALRQSRAPDTAGAILLAVPALLDTRNAAVKRLGERLSVQLAQGQRPDGAWAVSSGPRSIQQELVTTAAATRTLADIAAVPDPDPLVSAARQRRAALARVRAAGVFERHRAALTDPYTAAWVLVSGAVEGEQAAALQQVVLDAVEARPDGSRVVPVPAGVRRFDGTAPTTAEVTALATQVLQGTGHDDVVADLGAGLLAAWRPGAGWGDGHADLEGMRALLRLFAAPLPDPVTVSLTRDGEPVASRTLSGEALRDLSVLTAPAGAARGPHTWGVAATPAVPGVGFAFTLESWVPWTPTPGTAGLDLALVLDGPLRVGQPQDLRVQVAAPAGTALTLAVPLPPGLSPVEDALRRLDIAGTIDEWEAEDGKLVLHLGALEPGATFRAAVPVVPTFAGRFETGPASLVATSAPEAPHVLAPSTWTVAP